MCIYNLKYIRNLQYTLGVVWFQGWIKTLHVKPYYYQFDIHTQLGKSMAMHNFKTGIICKRIYQRTTKLVLYVKEYIKQL